MSRACSFTFAAALCAAWLSLATGAHAQESGSSAPPARTGFQLAVRAGYAIPMGKFDAGAGHEMSNVFSGQVPFTVDIGGKVTENIFVGGYLGLAVGGTAGTWNQLCDAGGGSCASASLRIGIEGQYHFTPQAKQNFWLGYGIGYESSAATGSGGNSLVSNTVTISGSGFDLAHFMGGVDFRLNRVIGIGPFIDFSIGRYTKATIDDGMSINNTISKTALHEWLMIGARLVFFP